MKIKEQIKYIKDNFDIVINDLVANRDRFIHEDKICELEDYDNVGVFDFGNWVRPDAESDRIYYRFRIKARE